MKKILGLRAVNESAIETLIRYLEKNGRVCAKVLDVDGRVTDVNERGLTLLRTSRDKVCGQVWTSFWEGAENEKAEAAVRKALSGEISGFTGEFFGTGEKTVWSIDIFPLSSNDGGITSVLVLSELMLVEAEDHIPLTSISETIYESLHDIRNVVNVSASSARILKRSGDDPLVARVAEGLSDAAHRAQTSVEDLARILAQNFGLDGDAAGRSA